MRVLTIGFLGGLLSFCGTAVQAQNEINNFSVDRSKYAQVRLQMTGGGNVFDGNCPDKDEKIFNISFKDLFVGGGEQVASLTAELKFPNGLEPQIFELVRVERSEKKLFQDRKCSITIREINRLSPLFNMSDIENQVFTVNLKLHRQQDGGGLFANSFVDVDEALKKVPILPVDALQVAGVEFPSLKEIGGYEGVIQSDKDLLVLDGQASNHFASWTIDPFDDYISKAITFKASLVATDALFGTDVASTNAGSVMARSFAAGQSPSNVRGYLLANAPAEFNTFNSANSIEAAGGACDGLFSEVDKMGFTPSDNSVVKWALLRQHPNLGRDPAIDHLQCSESVWETLPKKIGGTLPTAFAKRKIVEKIEKPPVQMRKANRIEMFGALAQGQDAAATFFKTADRRQRVRLGGLFFGDSFDMKAPDGFGLIDSAGTSSLSVQQLVLDQWDINKPLARNLGFFAASSSEPFDVPEGQVWAIGRFFTGVAAEEREAIVKMTFAPIEVGAPLKVVVSSIAFVDPTAEDAAAFITRFGRNTCRGDWCPQALK